MLGTYVALHDNGHKVDFLTNSPPENTRIVVARSVRSGTQRQRGSESIAPESGQPHNLPTPANPVALCVSTGTR